MHASTFQRACGAASLLAAFAVAGLLLAGRGSLAGPAAIAALAAFALYCRGHQFLKSYSFTAWVFAFVAASLVYPRAFGTWFTFDLKGLIVPLVQIIMFGMGTTLSLKDFSRVLFMPLPVLVGIFLHYTIMPLTGYTLATTLGFPPEVAAGVILIGSVSSGAASNLIAYLAGGNVALAVTITACSTLVSPIMTPFLMKILAGRMVPINFVAMVLEILNMVIVPVLAGLVTNKILYGSHPRWSQGGPLAVTAAASLLLALLTAWVPQPVFGPFLPLRGGAILGFGLVGAVALAKLAINVWLRRRENWMARALPLISMAGICFIIAIITARSREKLLTVGAALILAAMIHNAVGYLLGYWLARAVKLDEVTCRTIAIEVGMQNGGMASGLAMGVLRSADAALAPAIFGPWMNISGSILASWWRRRPAPAATPPSASAGSPRA